jgi:hypothetical protein
VYLVSIAPRNPLVRKAEYDREDMAKRRIAVKGEKARISSKGAGARAPTAHATGAALRAGSALRCCTGFSL